MIKRATQLYREFLAHLFRCGREGPCALPWYGEACRFLIMATRMFNRNNIFMRSAAMAFISTIGIFPLAAVLLTLLPVYFHGVEALGGDPNRLTSSAAHSAQHQPAETSATHSQVETSATQTNIGTKDAILIAASKTPAETALSVVAEMSTRKPNDTATSGAMDESRYAREVGDVLVKAIAPVGVDDAWKSSLEELFAKYRERSESIGTLGLIGLFLGAVALFNTTQGAMNHVWKAKRQRSFLQSMAVFSGVLVWLPLVVFLSLYLRNQMLRVNENAEGILTHAVPALFTLLFFAALYKYIPTVEVRWKSAFIAGLVSTILWTIAKGTIANYLVHMRNIQNLILTVGTIPYFIVWMYISWLILLLGVIVSYTHQNYHSLLAIEMEDTGSVIDPVVLLVLLYLVGENFVEGTGGVSFNALRDSCPISQGALNSHLTYLEHHNYICQKSGSDEYILQKPAERIALKDFLTFAPKAEHLFLSDHVVKHDIVRFLTQLDGAILKFIEKMTLHEMLQTFRTRESTLVCDLPVSADISSR